MKLNRMTLLASGILLHAGLSFAADSLVQFGSEEHAEQFASSIESRSEYQTENLAFNGWVLVKGLDADQLKAELAVSAMAGSVVHVQPNYKLQLLENYRLQDANMIAYVKMLQGIYEGLPFPIPGAGGGQTDNPEIPAFNNGGSGADPLFAKQWGMNDIGVKDGWKNTKGSAEIIVAVIDTGIDYTHEDLQQNLWRNPGEMGRDENGLDRAANNKDDDGNGYVDDQIGWDFVSNDNKPYDLAVDPFQLLLGGGNPGHGTHCAGNVAARADNGRGIAGVAPGVKIMGLRFLSEKGQGTTADAVKAVNYAIKNGARVMSNSWGSSGEDPQDAENNKALRDAVAASEKASVLFVAAAGNGNEMGQGYDNDTSQKPAYPASYPDDVIVSVAALDVNNALGTFSNWGARGVDIGAPGVKVFSTTVGGQYSDMVIDMFGLQVGWDGTSMATPHVAGAAALYLSAHPNANWKEIKTALLNSVEKIPALSGKSVSGGKLNVRNLMK